MSEATVAKPSRDKASRSGDRSMGQPLPADDVHLRLPPEYGPLLDTMKSKTGRARTVSAQIAIERLAREMGLPFKPNWPELLTGPSDSPV